MARRSERAAAQQQQQQAVVVAPVFCTCRQPDDSTRPMIACDGGCDDWFHWDCVGLDDEREQSVADFICPNCEVTTGRKTTFLPGFNSSLPGNSALPTAPMPPATLDPSLLDPSLLPQPPAQLVPAPPAEPAPSEPDDDMIIVEEGPSYVSPPPTNRKTSSSAPTKRKESSTAEHKDRDKLVQSTRKQCADSIETVVKPLLGEEKAPAFAQQLEQLVWVAEVGESASGRKKYLDRMRSLRFNVSKPDRKVLREGIQDGTITAEALSTITTAELANPALQDQMKSAQQESIRERFLVAAAEGPLMSHSHKGLAEFTDTRQEAQRVEARERALVEAERNQRKREREYEESVAGMVEKAQAEQTPEEEGSPKGSATEAPNEKKRRTSDGRPANTSALSPVVARKTSSPVVPTTLAPSHRFSLDAIWGSNAGAAEQSTTPPASPGGGEGVDETLNEFLSFDVFGQPSGNGQDAHGDGSLSPFRDAGAHSSHGDDPNPFDFFADDDKSEFQAPPPKVAPVTANLKNSGREGPAIGSTPYGSDLQVDGEGGLMALQIVWECEVSNPDEPHPGPMQARQVGGPRISQDGWNALLPSKTLGIVGRVKTENSRKYLGQSQLSPSKEIIVVLLEGAGVEGAVAVEGHKQFLLSRDRDALIQPHGPDAALPAGAARELYILVVRKDESIPDFLEFLSSSKIPEENRTRDYLLGVFVRSKATSSAAAPVQQPPANPTPPQQPTPPVANPHVPTPAHQPAPPTIPDPSSIASLLAGLHGMIPQIGGAPMPYFPPQAPLGSHSPSPYAPPPPPPSGPAAYSHAPRGALPCQPSASSFAPLPPSGASPYAPPPSRASSYQPAAPYQPSAASFAPPPPTAPGPPPSHAWGPPHAQAGGPYPGHVGPPPINAQSYHPNTPPSFPRQQHEGPPPANNGWSARGGGHAGGAGAGAGRGRDSGWGNRGRGR